MHEEWTLITGGSGFIGTNLSKQLLQQGINVIALDNHLTSLKKQKYLFFKNSHYKFIYHDITKKLPKELLPENISIQTIYHFACPTGVSNLIPLAEEMALACSLGTFNILNLAKKHNSEIIYASSSEVYGNPKVSPQSENYTGNVSTIGVRSPYEEGKRFSETLLMLFVKKYKLKGKIIRIFNTYGPFMSLNDTRVIPKFIQQLKSHQPLTIQGDGKNTRTFCYIDDLVKGILLIKKQGKNEEIYNLGSDEEITIYNLAKKILFLRRNNYGLKYIPQFSEDHKSRKPSLGKIKQLGWNMQFSLDEGLKRTMQWYGL